MLVRRDVWEWLGGFHEGVRSGADVEFCWRVQDADWSLEHRPEARVEHVVRELPQGSDQPGNTPRRWAALGQSPVSGCVLTSISGSRSHSLRWRSSGVAGDPPATTSALQGNRRCRADIRGLGMVVREKRRAPGRGGRDLSAHKIGCYCDRCIPGQIGDVRLQRSARARTPGMGGSSRIPRSPSAGRAFGREVAAHQLPRGRFAQGQDP